MNGAAWAEKGVYGGPSVRFNFCSDRFLNRFFSVFTVRFEPALTPDTVGLNTLHLG